VNFADAYAASGLQPTLLTTFTGDVAKMVLDVKVKEGIDPSVLGFTWYHESTFKLNPRPQTNGAAANPGRWDTGPIQTNCFWSLRSIWVGEYKGGGLDPVKCFGANVFSLAPDPNMPFDGDPLSNLRLGARHLFSLSKDRELSVTKYTGPEHQDSRRASWRQLGPMFDVFFANYTGAN
jgi:hypothetical protein